jgi:predicted Zn-dependent protease
VRGVSVGDVSDPLENAILAFRQQRPAEAERLAAEVLAADPKSVLAAHVLGSALLMQHRPAEAIAPLRTAAWGGDDPANETLLARALAGAGRREEALDELRRATARRPPYPLAFLELGEQLGGLGRLEEAVAAFEEGLALVPDADGLRIGLAYVQLQRNDRVEARRLFAQVRAASPDRVDAMVGLARTIALDGEYPAAAELYQRALDLRPDDAATRIALGKCLLELGERDAGEAELRRAAQGAAELTGMAGRALAGAPYGRFFLRPSALARFLGVRA